MENKKFQLAQLCAVIFFIMRSGYLGIGLSGYIKFGGPNAYLCPLIGGIIGLIPLYLFLKISKLNEDGNINELIRKTFGKIFGNFISIVLLLFIAIYGVIIFWDLNNFIASEYLYNTPIIAIVILLIIPIIYMLIKGPQTQGRSAIILSYISLFLFLLSAGGLISQIKLDNVLPFLENGIFPVIKGSFIFIAYSVLPIFIALIIPRNKFQQTDKYDKFVLVTYIVVTLLLSTMTFIIMSVLGIDLASLYQYADYHVLRRITIGNFIQRVESLLAVQWIVSLFVLISLCFYYTTNTIEYIFNIGKKKYQRMIIFTVSLLLMYLSTIIFRNNTVAMNFNLTYLPFIIFIMLFIIPLLIYPIAKLKCKK